ncbi:hypothetical protein DY000_02044675 [Brassica cretica]|uniref:Uncharacterized protein n=1 Tax=Brassica cretica TaxID=69181 RepID=A0ABQ7ENN1_BRACR|nr:hypothetical protein DY000_02044675 [Brassica cretica]
MFRLHFAYMSLYQVIIGRAEDGSEFPQRRHEVAPKHLSERPSWSDPVKSLAIFIPLEAQSDLPRATHRGRSHLTPLSERPPKATPRGRSRLYGETTRSEARRMDLLLVFIPKGFLKTTFISYISFGELSSVPPCTSKRRASFENVSPTTSQRKCWREDELLSRYTDYFAKALSGVSFPCVKMFNESPNLSTLIDVPLFHISQSIYGTTHNWMNLPPVEVLYFSVFILCAFDQILLDLEAQQGGGDDSKSQVGMFVALAIVLRCKPEALTSVLPTLREDPKYQGGELFDRIIAT